MRKHVKDKLPVNWYETSVWCLVSFYLVSTMGEREVVWLPLTPQGKEVAGWFIVAASIELIAVDLHFYLTHRTDRILTNVSP